MYWACAPSRYEVRGLGTEVAPYKMEAKVDAGGAPG